jgi:hypothetical protein
MKAAGREGLRTACHPIEPELYRYSPELRRDIVELFRGMPTTRPNLVLPTFHPI